jgi:4-hydroxy-tetrahydrodipicolinate reductase
MKVAILGYGKMGMEVETVLLSRNHEITLRASAERPFKPEDLINTDIAIEFSTPDTAVDNIYKCFEANCPVVVGTTGWYMRIPEIREETISRKQSLLFASNFSIGVNIMFHLNRQMAMLMNQIDEYEPLIEEIHHLAKKDKPSGTAITLAEDIISNVMRKTKWKNEKSEASEELSILSIREGEVAGIHTVSYTSSIDKLSLTHEAFNRRGFALGAVKSAEWLFGKKGFYTINDYLHF